MTLLFGWQEGHPAWKKTEWCGAGVVVCLERGADLHTAQLMPLLLTVSCFSKIQIVLPFWYPVVKADRRIRWHYTTTILRLRIGARLTRYRNCKFDNFARTISRHADGISRYSVRPSAGPLLPLCIRWAWNETGLKWGRGWQYWWSLKQVRTNILWESRWGWTNVSLEFGTFEVFSSLLRIRKMCPTLIHESGTPGGVTATTSESPVQRPNHYNTGPPCFCALWRDLTIRYDTIPYEMLF